MRPSLSPGPVSKSLFFLPHAVRPMKDGIYWTICGICHAACGLKVHQSRFKIELVKETGQVDVFDSLWPFGAKGIGESEIVATVAAVGNTFYHATDLEMNELPLSPERILKALNQVRSESPN
jgi:hypothetical protein